MVYTKQTWADNDASKPLSAARMNVLEAGVAAAQDGVINAASYGLLPGASAAANTTAMAAAVTAMRSAKLPIYVPPGAYSLATGIDMRATSSWAGGGGLIGAGVDATTFTVQDNTSPLLQVGGFRCTYADFMIQHAGTSPDGTYGDGLVFNKTAYCTFKRIDVRNARRSYAIAQVSVNDPGTSTGSANWMFSCSFEDMSALRYHDSALYLRSIDGGSTGSVWTNTYLQNVNLDGSRRTPAGNPVDLFLVDEMVFNQLNIEDAEDVGTAVLINSCGQITFNALSLERVNLSGFNPQYVRCYSRAGAVIDGFSLRFSDVARAGASGSSRLVSVELGANIEVRGISFNNVTKTRGASGWTAAEVTGAADANNHVDIGPQQRLDSVAFTTPSLSLGAAIKRIGQTRYDSAAAAAAVVSSGRAFKSGAAQAVAAFATAVVTLESTTTITGANVSAATNGLTAVVAGYYDVAAVARCVGGATGERSVSLLVNGSAVREWGGGVAGRYAFSDTVLLPAGAVVTMQVYSGVAITVEGTAQKDTGITLTYRGPSS